MAIARIADSTAQHAPTAASGTCILNISDASLQVGDWMIVAVSRYLGGLNETPTAPAVADVAKDTGNATFGTAVLDKLVLNQYGAESPYSYLWSALFHLPVTGAGGSNMLHANNSAIGHWQWAACVGIRGSAALSVEDTDAGTGASGGAVTGTVSTAGAGYLAGAAAWDSSTDITITQVSPWTQIFAEGNADTVMTGALLEQIVTGAATDAAEWSSPTTPPWSATVVAYTDGTGGSSLDLSVGTVLIETPF